MASGFEELKVWQQCRSFKIEISKLVKTFPKHELYSLTSQLSALPVLLLLILPKAMDVIITEKTFSFADKHAVR